MGDILVFGGNRFVGKHLVEELLEQGYNVDMFNRSATGPDYVMETCEGNIIQGDRNNQEDIDKINFDRYDTIVDMCLFFESQFDLIENHISEKTNYIFVSSGAANQKYSEHYGDYGYDKKQVERRLQDSKLNYKIVRPSYIVGEGNHRPRLGHYLNMINNREHIEVAGNGQNKVNVVFVQDVVRDLIRLVKTPYKTYELVESVGDNIEVIDLIYKLKEYSIYKENEVMLVQNDENAILPKNEFVFDIKSEYTKLDEGIKEYTKWFYNEGAKKYGYII